MTSLRWMFGWYFGTHWKLFDAFFVLSQSALAIWISTNQNSWLISAVVIIVSLDFLCYSYGRRHQSEIDSKQMLETVAMAKATQAMLKECFIFEAFYLDMSADPDKPTRILIHSRVCPN